MTWDRYARQLRLLSAMTLLAEPGPTVLEVARLVGFASPSAFTRAFRQATGESPTAFRHRVTRQGDPSAGPSNSPANAMDLIRSPLLNSSLPVVAG
jgi:AraC-like DNA-binding protein